MNQVDLHCHTTASDGMLTPEELVRRAAHLGVSIVAITDHDTVAGVPAAIAAGRPLGVEVIPGVEINTDVPGSEAHILGYYVNDHDSALADELARLRDGRLRRAREMVAKLAEMGAPVALDRVLQIAGEGSVGRPHLAQALLEGGYVLTFNEAFDRYLGRNSPAYVERDKFTPAQACQLIRRSGGVPVLAHPIILNGRGGIKNPLPLEVMLPELRDAGLLGLEVYYPGYDAVISERLMALARRYRLLMTGGTDFHVVLPERLDLGGIYVPLRAVRRLRSAWERLHADRPPLS
jgi:3',5'-nucleoside bisphosphate phosphatase